MTAFYFQLPIECLRGPCPCCPYKFHHLKKPLDICWIYQPAFVGHCVTTAFKYLDLALQFLIMCADQESSFECWSFFVGDQSHRHVVTQKHYMPMWLTTVTQISVYATEQKQPFAINQIVRINLTGKISTVWAKDSDIQTANLSNGTSQGLKGYPQQPAKGQSRRQAFLQNVHGLNNSSLLIYPSLTKMKLT